MSLCQESVLFLPMGTPLPLGASPAPSLTSSLCFLRGGRTETGLALKSLHRGFPGGRDGAVPQLLIIITDGKAQGPVALPAKQLKERGIIVFAVGVRFPR